MIIQEAGIMNFLRTLLIIAFIYYAIKFLAKLFAPYLMKKAVEKMQRQNQQNSQYTQPENDVKKGETVIDKKPRTTRESNKDVGEYVDFEEVD